MPKMLAQSKGNYKIVFDSPITRTQKSEWASGAVRAMEIFTNYSQATQDPSILDYIDMDHAAPQIADIYGVPQTWIRSQKDIAAIRSQRGKQQALQASIQAGPAVAGLAKAGVPIPGMGAPGGGGGGPPQRPMTAPQKRRAGR